MVERAGLENRRAFRGPVGSNPTRSANTGRAPSRARHLDTCMDRRALLVGSARLLTWIRKDVVGSIPTRFASFPLPRVNPHGRVSSWPGGIDAPASPGGQQGGAVRAWPSRGRDRDFPCVIIVKPRRRNGLPGTATGTPPGERGRAVEGSGLENRRTGDRSVGSNPTASATLSSLHPVAACAILLVEPGRPGFPFSLMAEAWLLAP